MENNRFVEIVGDNYSAPYKSTRYACRGVVVQDEKILLSYVAEEDGQEVHLWKKK